MSVAIPVYQPRLDYFEACVRSAQEAAPEGSEVVVMIDSGDPDAMGVVERADVAVRVRLSTDEPGLAGTWNECLRHTGGELLHILHQDDRVEPGYYSSVLAAREQFPGTRVFATGFRAISDDERAQPVAAAQAPTSTAPVEAQLFEDDDAARFLLGAGRHCCGSVTLARADGSQLGGFSPAYPPCPDEEAYPRFARSGGVAFLDAPLYLEREHDDQARYRTWLDRDFTRSYFRARRDAARAYSPEVEAYARKTTVRRVCSSMVTTAAAGHRAQAARQIASLFATDARTALAWRAWAAIAACVVPGAAARAVRRRES